MTRHLLLALVAAFGLSLAAGLQWSCCGPFDQARYTFVDAELSVRRVLDVDDGNRLITEAFDGSGFLSWDSTLVQARLEVDVTMLGARPSSVGSLLACSEPEDETDWVSIVSVRTLDAYDGSPPGTERIDSVTFSALERVTSFPPSEATYPSVTLGVILGSPPDVAGAYDLEVVLRVERAGGGTEDVTIRIDDVPLRP